MRISLLKQNWIILICSPTVNYSVHFMQSSTAPMKLTALLLNWPATFQMLLWRSSGLSIWNQNLYYNSTLVRIHVTIFGLWNIANLRKLTFYCWNCGRIFNFLASSFLPCVFLMKRSCRLGDAWSPLMCEPLGAIQTYRSEGKPRELHAERRNLITAWTQEAHSSSLS